MRLRQNRASRTWSPLRPLGRRVGRTTAPVRPGLAARLIPTLLAGLILALASSMPLRAAVEARLSSDTAAPGQPVTLTLVSPAPLARGIDLSPLVPDFQVMEQRRAQSVQTINGQRREQYELILTLLPSRTGTLDVPELRIGDERTVKLPLRVSTATNPAARLLYGADDGAVEPGPAPKPHSVDLSASIRPSTGVVGQEFLLRLLVSSAEGEPVGRFVPPSIADAQVLLLGEQRGVDADGRAIFEQTWSVFPRAIGRLSIADAGFDAWQPAGGAPVRHLAAPVSVEVSRPSAYDKPDSWLPARALTLTEAGPSQVRVAPGQAVERMVTLRAEGLSAEQLPALTLHIPEDFRPRADAPRLWNEATADGVVGYRTERVLINADAEGRTELPATSIDWWDTTADRLRSAELPAWTLTVAPFASEPRRAATPWDTDSSDPAAADPGAQAPLPEVIDASQPDRSSTPWAALLAGAAALLALILAALIGRRLRRRAGPAAGAATSIATELEGQGSDAPAPELRTIDALEAIRRAYDSRDQAVARDALLAWARLQWPTDPPRNLSQLVLRLEPPLRDDLKLLDGAFYGPDDGTWAMRPVADRLQGLATADRGEIEQAEQT